MFQWADELVASEKKRGKQCVTIGLSCVQGGGKTTATRYMEEMFACRGHKCVAVSIDDFYLTHDKQNEVASKHKDNKMLQVFSSKTSWNSPRPSQTHYEVEQIEANFVALYVVVSGQPRHTRHVVVVEFFA